MIKEPDFFASETHKQAFAALSEKFPSVHELKEYASSCYLLSHPDIFRFFKLERLQTPFDFFLSDNIEKSMLSTGANHLFLAAFNFWNGDPQFNLMKALSFWDENYRKTFMQGLELRM